MEVPPLLSKRDSICSDILKLRKLLRIALGELCKPIENFNFKFGFYISIEECSIIISGIEI